MIELRPTDEIDEAYILELHEYRAEWVKLMNAFISESLSEEEVANVAMLVFFYCSTIPDLQKFKEEDLITGIAEVLTFLHNLIDYAESVCGELSNYANDKIREHAAVIRYINNRLTAIEMLEKSFSQS